MGVIEKTGHHRKTGRDSWWDKEPVTILGAAVGGFIWGFAAVAVGLFFGAFVSGTTVPHHIYLLPIFGGIVIALIEALVKKRDLDESE